MDLALKLLKARTELLITNPFFGMLLLRMKYAPIVDPMIPYMGIDGRYIHYNENWLTQCPAQELISTLAHEVLHVALFHVTRRMGREPDLWNRACDYAINPMLRQAGFTLEPIEEWLYDVRFLGWSAEEIYATLLKERPQKPTEEAGGEGKNGGQGEDSKKPPKGGVFYDNPASQGAGGSKSTQEAEEADIKGAIAQAMYGAKQAGKCPAFLERLIDGLLTPVIPWRDILKRFLTDKTPDAYSWSKGNRRFIYQNLFLPSLYSEGSGEIAVVIDTSGSISAKELNEFGAEIRSIMLEARPSKLYVMYCDAQVNHIDEFAPDDELFFKAHGGGGTDFRPPFEWLNQQSIVPKCLVYLTDGYGPFPDEQNYPVLWVINNTHVCPPHGEHLELIV